MNEKTALLCGVIGGIGSYIANILGGWDNAVAALLFFMAVDFVMGLFNAAFFRKSDKSKSGALSSKACWQGIVKKCCTLLIVACGAFTDRLLGTDYLRNAIVIAFCVSELISITESAALMGVMPPGVQNIFNKIIDLLKNDKEDK